MRVTRLSGRDEQETRCSGGRFSLGWGTCTGVLATLGDPWVSGPWYYVSKAGMETYSRAPTPSKLQNTSRVLKCFVRTIKVFLLQIGRGDIRCTHMEV